MRFVSTDVKRDGDDWAVTGDLTIKDITKPVTIDFEQTGSAQRPLRQQPRRLRGRDAVNRKDFGLTWNAALETGGVLVSDKIKLEFDISAIKSAPRSAQSGLRVASPAAASAYRAGPTHAEPGDPQATAGGHG